MQRSAHAKEDGLQRFRLCLLLPMFVAPALAADADNGKRLAEVALRDVPYGGTESTPGGCRRPAV